MKRRKNLSEKDIQTIIAVFGELRQKDYNELNTFLGSITIEDMQELYKKLLKWYDPEKYAQKFDPEYWL